MLVSVRVRSLLAALVVLAGCRVDVEVALTVGADGTGELVVTAAADAGLVERAPGLAEDLRFDDATTAGWVVEGPDTPDDGGLTVTLRHPVTSAADATNLLASLGPPFADVTLARTMTAPGGGGDTTNVLSGQLQLTGGFAAFADAELLEAVGGTPFAADIAETGATPVESMAITFRADLPGEVAATTGESEDGSLVWVAPLDGAVQDLATQTVQSADGGGSGWAGPVSTVALVALVAWLALAATVLVAVARARARRRRSAR